MDGNVIGTITSGGPSPTLGRNIAMGYVPPEFSALGTDLKVIVRGKPAAAEVVATPFVAQRYYSFAVVESVKAASDVYAPVSGEVVEGNAALASAPETVNADPEGDGWFAKIKVSDASQLDSLMDRAAYDEYLSTL